MDNSDWRQAPLAEVVTGGHLSCSLEAAALVLARQEYPSLDPAPWLARLDAMAALARPMLSEQADPAEIIGVVNDVLFRDLQFRGNTRHYLDPRNSFLNDVLERRTGIPISLCVLYAAVARRVGLELHGTGFPGHFLLVHTRPGWPVVIDAFGRGQVLAQQDCERLLERQGRSWDERVLAPVSPLAVLRRMLENLQNIYLERQDWPRLLRTSAQIAVVHPDEADLHFIQGVALAALGSGVEAIAALERFLTRKPGAPNRDHVLDLLSELRRAADAPE